jgi:hypothetical protein
MSKLSDVFINDTVVFVYSAGSTPGSDRRVKVDTIDHIRGLLAGEDLSLGMNEEGKYPYRQFRFEYIDEDTLEIIESETNAAKLPPIKGERVSFVDVQGEIADRLNDLTPAELAKLYMEITDAEEEMVFDDATGDFVIPEKPAAIELVLMDSDECTFNVLNKDGQSVQYALECYGIDDDTIKFYRSNIAFEGVEEFAKDLAEHLDI